MQFLDSLNPEQREAVLHRDGPLLILAGAGSGKTRVITSRIAYLVGDGHAKPNEVLAVTFTNKAAEEMRGPRRVAARFRRDRHVGVDISRAVRPASRREAPAIGLSRDFVIYDSSDQLSVVKQALKELQVDDSYVQPRAALSRISTAKNKMETPEQMAAGAGWNRRDETDRENLQPLPQGAEGEQRAGLRRSPAQDRGPVRAVRARALEILAAVPLT